MELHNFNNCIAHCEALGLSKVFKAYSQYAYLHEIESIGFNENSGYVYIALDYGICICSCLGQDVEYLVTNFDNGKETFFDTFEEAANFDPCEEEEEEEEEEFKHFEEDIDGFGGGSNYLNEEEKESSTDEG
jgi:hypothetical protein